MLQEDVRACVLRICEDCAPYVKVRVSWMLQRALSVLGGGPGKIGSKERKCFVPCITPCNDGPLNIAAWNLVSLRPAPPSALAPSLQMQHFDAGVRHWLVQLTNLFGQVREMLA